MRIKKEEEQVQATIAKYMKQNAGVELVTTKSGLRYLVLQKGKENLLLQERAFQHTTPELWQAVKNLTVHVTVMSPSSFRSERVL